MDRRRTFAKPCVPWGGSRRQWLQGVGAATVAAWLPNLGGDLGGAPAGRRDRPPAFPAGIPVQPQPFRNWSGEIRIPAVWTAMPRQAQEVVAIANWAHGQGWRVRPLGRSHGWAPLLVTGGGCASGYLLVDTRHLDRVTLQADRLPATVTAQTGVTLDALLAQLEEARLGFAAVPAPGDLSLGGALAVDGHGTALPARGETPLPGQTFGSLANAVLSLTAVVWDGQRYALRTFRRDEPGIQPLLVHAGRAFITEATLQVAADQNLRCQSRMDIPADELFAPPGEAGPRAFGAWVEACGRVEAIWFPFAGAPWLKVWSLAPLRPWSSRARAEPYAYSFANWVTPAQDQFVQELVLGRPTGTPTFQVLEQGAVAAGLTVTDTWDLWGPARRTLLYVKPSTLRQAECGYAVLTSRSNIQRVVSEYYQAYAGLVARYQSRGQFPMNGAVEIRVTGLDQAGEVLLPGALEPQLSALRPWPGRPDWDCAVWLDALTCPGTPGELVFKTELEAWLLANYTGAYAGVRVEWAKGWGYTEAGAWTSPGVLDRTIPDSFAGRPGDDWPAALAALDATDPARIFSNPFLDRLMPRSPAT